MPASPSISVVIPFRNRTEFLQECLDSALGQTLPPAEVIVVDDNSDQPAQQFLKTVRRPTVRVVRLERSLGAAGARNAGIEQAKSEFIAFLDDDDTWEPDKLAAQAGHVRSHPGCRGVHTAIRAIYPDGVERIYDKKSTTLTLKDSLEMPPQLILSSLLIETQALRDVGGFDASLRGSEDLELSIRLASAGYRLDFLPVPLVRFRRSGHHHLSGRVYLMMRNNIAVVRKHRALYEQVHGPGAARKQIGATMRSTGIAAGGVVGRVTYALGYALSKLP